jgi:hypothetical protein
MNEKQPKFYALRNPAQDKRSTKAARDVTVSMIRAVSREKKIFVVVRSTGNSPSIHSFSTFARLCTKA